METSKALQEQIDALAVEARALIDVAKRESRELTDDESKRFDEITEKLVPEAKVKLESARKRDDAILRLTNETRRQNKADEINEMLYGEPSRPHTILPVNGRFVQDDAEPQIYVRQAKLKAFKKERDAFDAGMWMRAIVAKERNREDIKAMQHCSRRGLMIDNTSSTLTGAGGGYLLPAPISQSLIDVRENVGVARKVCQVMPMTADTLTIPKRSAGLTVYAPGEANTITTSDKSWSQVELIAKKRAVASYISQELVDDALISIVDNVVSEMAYALALQEDNELINGTGAATTYFGVRGLLNRIGSAGVSTAATGHDTWPELDIADFTSAIGLLPERYNRMPVWICSSNFYHTAMLRVLSSAGGNTANDLARGPSDNVRSFLGYPVYLTSQMPTSTAAATVCALFGAFDMAVILGDRTGITMGRDDSTGFLSDLITLKATTRYDFNVHAPGTSAAVGAYVALKTAS